MTGRLQLLEHEHSLKLKPHRHTSYPALMGLVVVTAVLLLGLSYGAEAAPPVVNPQAGSVGLTGTVPGPPPNQPAVITSIIDGSHTSSSPVTVSGTCPANTFVFIDKNGVLGGQAACVSGRFSLAVDLFAGTNQLVARVVDALGQSGPDSSPVTIIYDLPPAVAAQTVSGRQLFLRSDATVVAGSPGTELTRSVEIVGGTPPYAISWDWGDNASSLATVVVDGKVSAKHSYTSPGIYQVIVRVSDQAGNAAFMQLVTVVNGPVAAVTGANSGNSDLSGKLGLLWPVVILAGLLVLTFWLGERRERHRLLVKERLGSAF